MRFAEFSRLLCAYSLMVQLAHVTFVLRSTAVHETTNKLQILGPKHGRGNLKDMCSSFRCHVLFVCCFRCLDSVCALFVYFCLSFVRFVLLFFDCLFCHL